jgi:hypothetical protein
MGRHRQKTILGSGMSCIVDNVDSHFLPDNLLDRNETWFKRYGLISKNQDPSAVTRVQQGVVGRPQRLAGEPFDIRDGLGFRVNAFQVANQEVLAYG